MLLALFLHLYQPPTQFAKVLKSIADASYQRLLNSISRHASAKATLNVSGSLTEQLASQGFGGLIKGLKELVEKGQVELVGSAAYHPLLTEIPNGEVKRQIILNDEINRKYFGRAYQPRGFFPPEMAVDERVLKVVADLGFEWVIVDQSALGATGPAAGARRDALRPRHPSPGGVGLTIFVRNTDLSVKVAFSQIRTVEELIRSYELQAPRHPLILAMDGETFGHHRPEQLQFLEELFSSPAIELVTLSELQSQYPNPPEVTIKKSSWGPWERWKNPKNPIHQWQWQLTNLAIRSVDGSECKVQSAEPSLKFRTDKTSTLNLALRSELCTLHLSDQGKLTPEQRQWLKARNLLDRALHSDQYWWASGEPFYHYQMVERGARMLRDVASTVRAKELYDKITSK